jgi:hypothetical protein
MSSWKRSAILVLALMIVAAGACSAGFAASASQYEVNWTCAPTRATGIIRCYADVAVGTGPFDVIRVHHVFKDSPPAVPQEAVMLLPGLPTTFDSLYMLPEISPAAPPEHSISVYLANHDVDVWGMDFGWALVPIETTDFSFMKGWGLMKDVEHVRAALSIARATRRLKDPNAGPVFLSGLSYGAVLTYPVAGEDAEQPPAARDVKGIIPIDYGVRWRRHQRVLTNAATLSRSGP